MSVYRITGAGDLVLIECDGTPIETTAYRRLARPLYAVGERSDGSINVAHAVLRHCCGRGVAEQLAEDFVAEFLLGEPPFEIPSDKIKTFVQSTFRIQSDAWQAVRKAKQI